MPAPSISSWNTSDVDAVSFTTSTLPRRIRHITSIQIRNLTPFPVRDALASALTKPSEQPQFTPYGHLSDDLDVTLGRKRGRRISAASLNHSGSRGDEEGTPGSLDRSGEPTIRRRTSSRNSVPVSSSAGSSSPKLSRRTSTVGPTPAVRPTHRPRTSSLASSHSHQAAPSSALSGDFGPSTSSFFPDLLQDTSQKKLEKILQSRLVETFLTITLLSSGFAANGTVPNTPSVEYTDHLASPSSPRSPSPSRSSKETVSSRPGNASKVMTRRGTVGAAATPSTSRSPVTPTRHGASASVSSPKTPPAGYGKSASISLSNGKTPKSPSTPPAQKARSPTSAFPSQYTSASSTLSDNSHIAQTDSESPDDSLSVPDYISPIHWPSTNPVFQLSRDEFAPGTDLSGAKMRVDVWGHTGPHSSSTFRPTDALRQLPERTGDVKGKGKEKEPERVEGDPEWKVLGSWEVTLTELRPVPEELAHNPAHMPSNTLLITLSTGETFYVPPRSLRSSSQSRAPSPNTGYNSDPETDVHRGRGVGEIGLQSPKLKPGLDSLPTSPTMSEIDWSLRKKRPVKSATWQDLLKLINLQTVILDTEQSLGEVVQHINKAVVHNEANVLAREVSEREAWLAELHMERSKVVSESESLRNRILARREDLRKRHELLAQAKMLHEQDLSEQVWVEETISEERTRLSSLRKLLPVMRSNLISIVAFIYPIELVSPPDLLFSILDVPLAIPIAATDPAPPLTLPTFPKVTEDSVATALGYSAQVVQLLSAYMGHRLVYPVTCVGSRSMIKDGISAMVGPRNFPLFSKGVDTYRFEYGVFLLNKDVEMLMSERNLRALDMRHTLPNLKNLLLTLTDNVQRSIPGHRVASSSVSISSLQSQSPVPATSSLPSDAKPVGRSGAQTLDGIDSDNAGTSASGSASVSENRSAAVASTNSTPPASGTTTPTKATQRKPRTFLDLAPLTGFLTLRGRYSASQKPSVKPVVETPESEAQASVDVAGADGRSGGSGEGGEGVETEDDDDDRQTIRGVGVDATVNDDEEDMDEVVEGKVNSGVTGGGRHNPKCGTANGREKVTDDAVAPSPLPMVLSS